MALEMMKKSTTSTFRTSSDKKADPDDRIDDMHNRGFHKRHLAGLKRNEYHGPADEMFHQLRPKARRDSLVILVGDRGTGKTQIATRMAYERKGSPGNYVTAVGLFSVLKSTFDGKGDTQAELKILKSAKFLVIDEMNESLGTDWERQVMTDILDHRYGEMLSTVIIANLTAEAAKEQLGRSVCSRAQETGGFVTCDWPSYRGAKNG